jgi:hypothetical protein
MSNTQAGTPLYVSTTINVCFAKNDRFGVYENAHLFGIEFVGGRNRQGEGTSITVYGNRYDEGEVEALIEELRRVADTLEVRLSSLPEGIEPEPFLSMTEAEMKEEVSEGYVKLLTSLPYEEVENG